ncbi:MAG: DUF4160 domain-containing protein [Oscillospiraceae bacterium]|nr:DUF4160 domain-containing protein [Oscillospiraceae bacterium]
METVNIEYRSLVKVDWEYLHGTDGGIALGDFAYLMSVPDLDSVIASDLFLRYSHFVFSYDYSIDTTIKDLVKTIWEKHGTSGDAYKNDHSDYVSICFFIHNQFIHCSNYNFALTSLIERFNVDGHLNVFFIYNGNAGEIWYDDGLRYYMRSHEQGSHSTPHVHVNYKHDASGTISITDGTVLSGDLPKKAIKKACERILNEQDYLINCWNNMTDGLYIDINYDWGKRKLLGVGIDT